MLMWHMLAIAQQQLQCVFSRGQFEGGLSLRFAEMFEMIVSWNRLVHFGQLVHIYHQMMMTGVGHISTSWCEFHALDTELNRYWALDSRAILWRGDKYFFFFIRKTGCLKRKR